MSYTHKVPQTFYDSWRPPSNIPKRWQIISGTLTLTADAWRRAGFVKQFSVFSWIFPNLCLKQSNNDSCPTKTTQKPFCKAMYVGVIWDKIVYLKSSAMPFKDAITVKGDSNQFLPSLFWIYLSFSGLANAELEWALDSEIQCWVGPG